MLANIALRSKVTQKIQEVGSFLSGQNKDRNSHTHGLKLLIGI
jgi:hypothetical protein